MGCINDREKQVWSFTPTEKQNLLHLFNVLCQHNGQKQGNLFHCKAFENLFDKEQRILARGIYKGMKDRIFSGYPHNQVNKKTFFKVMELLIKPDINLHIEGCEKLGKVAILSYLIHLENHKNVVNQIDKGDVVDSPILVSEGLEHIKAILSLFNNPKNSTFGLQDLGVKSVNDAIFQGENQVSMPWLSFAKALNSIFLYANEPITLFFKNTFMPAVCNYIPVVPQLEQASTLLTNEFLSMLYLSHQLVQTAKKWTMLFSGPIDNNGIKKLVNSLLHYAAPTLLLLRHEYSRASKIESNTIRNHAIIGCIISYPWSATGNNVNGIPTSLFSLNPRYNHLYSLPRHLDSIHSAIETSEDKTVIKIGSRTGGKCRLKISNDPEHCYLDDSDEIYGDTPLIHGVSHLKITDVEVWGLGYDTTFILQDQTKKGFPTQNVSDRVVKLFKENGLSTEIQSEVVVKSKGKSFEVKGQTMKKVITS